MITSVQDLSDRIAIQDLMTRYARAIDTHNYELMDTGFTLDAKLDYSQSNGPKGFYPEVRESMKASLADMAMMMHLVGSPEVELDQSRASSQTYVICPMGVLNTDSYMHQFTLGANYVDQLVRTEQGWRISERVEEFVYMDGTYPEVFLKQP